MDDASEAGEAESVQFSPEAEWLSILKATDVSLRRKVHALIFKERAELTRRFYQEMTADPLAGQFLNHSLVETRLGHGLQKWLDNLFRSEGEDGVRAACAQQRHAGEIHSRVNLPLGLVSRGARLLKRWVWDIVLSAPDLTDREKFEAMAYASDLIDIAIEVMNTQFLNDADRASRTDEAYRLLALSQDLALERERQRAALLEWNQHAFYAVYRRPPVRPMKISGSEFGMWLVHKASFIFENASEIAQISGIIEEIDKLVAEVQLGPESHAVVDLVALLEERVGQIKFLMNALFDRYMEVEGGRDVLTKLFNRRFLSSVLSREVELARRAHSGLAAVLIDIDHFKRVNDQYGHAVGDLVLQQVATMVMHAVRAGDFTFRYGGEEILVLLADVDAGGAMRVSETLRENIARATMPIPGDPAGVRVTVSLGVAVYDGHPDYSRLIERADQALYEAKRSGRNRSILSR